MVQHRKSAAETRYNSKRRRFEMGCKAIPKRASKKSLALSLMLLPGVTVQDQTHIFDLGAISQRRRRRVAVARCKRALKAQYKRNWMFFVDDQCSARLKCFDCKLKERTFLKKTYQKNMTLYVCGLHLNLFCSLIALCFSRW